MDSTATVIHLYGYLHEINVEYKLGNENHAAKLVGELNSWLNSWTGVRMRCWYSNETEEFVLQDTGLYGREQEENNG